MFNDWNAAVATPSPCNTQRTKGIYVYFVLCEYGMILSSCTVLQVMQIFMPVTAQLHPKEFPGEHPNDCPRNIKKAE